MYSTHVAKGTSMVMVRVCVKVWSGSGQGLVRAQVISSQKGNSLKDLLVAL